MTGTDSIAQGVHPPRRSAFARSEFTHMDTSNPIPAQTVAEPPRPLLRTKRGFVYEPAIGPRLKTLLLAIFTIVALLGATGAYLVAIRLLEVVRGLRYENQFSIGMFMIHVVFGVLVVIPFFVFGFTH